MTGNMVDVTDAGPAQVGEQLARADAVLSDTGEAHADRGSGRNRVDVVLATRRAHPGLPRPGGAS